MEKRTKIIIGILIVGTGIGVYLLTKKNNQVLNEEIVSNELGTAKSRIAFNAKEIAHKLHVAMNTSGTYDEDFMEAFAQISTDAQLLQVIKAFGKKPYNKKTGNDWSPPFYTLDKLGLKTWMQNDLDEKQYALLKNAYPKIL